MFHSPDNDAEVMEEVKWASSCLEGDDEKVLDEWSSLQPANISHSSWLNFKLCQLHLPNLL
jgi:hypothetical protein